MNRGITRKALPTLFVFCFAASLALALFTPPPAAAEDAGPAWGAAGVKVSDNGHPKRNQQIWRYDDNSTMVVWEDYNGSEWQLMAQLLDPQGNPQWGSGKRVCDFDSQQVNPQLGMTDFGWITVAWEDDRNGRSELFMQKICILDGQLWFPQGQSIFASDPLPQERASLVGNPGDGTFRLACQKEVADNIYETRAQKVDADGNPLWGDAGVKVADWSEIPSYPQMTDHGVVVWQTVFGPDYNVMAQKLDEDGNKLWGASGKKVNPVGTGIVPRPQVTLSELMDSYLVAWQQGAIGDCDAYVQKLDESGNKLWGNEGVKAYETSLVQTPEPRVFPGPGDGAFVAWQRAWSMNHGIACQYFDDAGQRQLGDDGLLASDRPSFYSMDWGGGVGDDGLLYLTAACKNSPGEVWAQKVDSSGQLRWGSSGVKVSAVADSQEEPVIAADGQGGAVISFLTTGGTPDGEVYAQRIAEGGGGSSWYLAEGCIQGDFETWVLVMNPNPGPVTVDLTFMTSAGPQPGPQGVAIPAHSRWSCNAASSVVDWDVSTRVDASGPVVCERAVYGNGRTWAHDSIG